MPELPEVETTVQGLVPVLQGRRLVSVEARRADLRRAFPADLRQRLTGATVTGLSRRAKYGLIDTDRGDTLVFHLGMSGRWRIDPAELGAHDHFLLETDEGRRAALNDPRRFGSLDLVATSELELLPAFAAMGPEPLGPEFDADHLLAALAGRSAPIKAMLLDQKIVAGLGNIYVCEALHMAGIAPRAPAAASRVHGSSGWSRRSARVLAAAIEAGGSSLRDYARPSGELGYFSRQWRVYGREGEACGCGSAIRRRVDSADPPFSAPAASALEVDLSGPSGVEAQPSGCGDRPRPFHFSDKRQSDDGEHAAGKKANPPQRAPDRDQPDPRQPHPHLRQAGRSRDRSRRQGSGAGRHLPGFSPSSPAGSPRACSTRIPRPGNSPA
jgi:formamidopyrimidine-DNA glycosylase